MYVSNWRHFLYYVTTCALASKINHKSLASECAVSQSDPPLLVTSVFLQPRW